MDEGKGGAKLRYRAPEGYLLFVLIVDPITNPLLVVSLGRLGGRGCDRTCRR